MITVILKDGHAWTTHDGLSMSVQHASARLVFWDFFKKKFVYISIWYQRKTQNLGSILISYFIELAKKFVDRQKQQGGVCSFFDKMNRGEPYFLTLRYFFHFCIFGRVDHGMAFEIKNVLFE
jgi:hypothetical protein